VDSFKPVFDEAILALMKVNSPINDVKNHVRDHEGHKCFFINFVATNDDLGCVIRRVLLGLFDGFKFITELLIANGQNDGVFGDGSCHKGHASAQPDVQTGQALVEFRNTSVKAAGYVDQHKKNGHLIID